MSTQEARHEPVNRTGWRDDRHAPATYRRDPELGIPALPAVLAPFSAGAWLVQGIAAAVATTVTMPYGALVGVLLYLDLRARKERLDVDTLKADLQASTA
jgi:hypothetical protein